MDLLSTDPSFLGTSDGLPISVSRRGLAVGIGGLLAGTAGLGFALRGSDSDRSAADHLVVVGNVRESSHEVTAETQFRGENDVYGQRQIGPQGHWNVTRFTTSGECTVSFRVDGEMAWKDTHEIPELSGSRSSITLLELQPDGKVLTRVKVEE